MRLEQYRTEYRSGVIPDGYDGRRNIRLNVLACSALLIASIALTGELSGRTAGYAALGLLVFDFFEYAFHRWISHRKWTALGGSYRRHTGQHHGFFDHENMSSDRLADYHVTVMPTRTIVVYYLLFFVVFIGPLLLAVGRARAFAFSTGIVLSLLQLDVLHYYYHLEGDAGLSRALDHFRCFRSLKARHVAHHNPRLMRHQGFNLTLPLFDWLFGTSSKRENRGS